MTPLKEKPCRVHRPARPPHRSPIHVTPEPEQMLIYKRTKKARRPCPSAGPTRRCLCFGSLRGMKRPPPEPDGETGSRRAEGGCLFHQRTSAVAWMEGAEPERTWETGATVGSTVVTCRLLGVVTVPTASHALTYLILTATHREVLSPVPTYKGEN